MTNLCLQCNGDIVDDEETILQEIRNFYHSLYTSIKTSPDPFLHDLPHTSLEMEDAIQCEGELTLNECFMSLNSMKNDKSPGSDGFSVNFYKHFWPLIGQFVVDSLNHGYRRGFLSPEQSRSIITLISKPGKDSTLLQNYRPISLLNVDYKIGAKAIANRFKRVIQSLIGPQQTGFLKGKFIGENVRFILDLIDYTSNHNVPGFLFLVDFEKAFDTLEWNYIQATLSFLNFGISIKTWISTFYKNAHACVLNNGYSTGLFPINRGVRQGCPLSPYLFILCVETLALRVNQSSIVKGIIIGGDDHRILQYADDTTFILDHNKSSLCGILDILDGLRKASGLKINDSKSQLFPLGSFISRRPLFLNDFNFEVVLGPVSMLGIVFTHNGDDLYRLNYQPKLLRLKNTLRIWATRDLTPIGRNIIVKSLGLSQLVYLFLVLPNPPSSFIKEVET